MEINFNSKEVVADFIAAIMHNEWAGDCILYTKFDFVRYRLTYHLYANDAFNLFPEDAPISKIGPCYKSEKRIKTLKKRIVEDFVFAEIEERQVAENIKRYMDAERRKRKIDNFLKDNPD